MVAATNTTVLITGETGTGKELVARAIHERQPAARAAARQGQLRARLGRRCSRASCSATRRARSPARSRKHKGRFELAHGGTLFLDEIGELPLETAGEAAARAAGARVRARRRQRDRSASTCASSRPPTATSPPMVARGQFREDLYYRLNVFPIALPPLRERARGHPAAGRRTSSRRYARQAGKPHRRRRATRRMRRLLAVQLAGQRARAGERHRARGGVRARATCIDVDALPDLSAAPSPLPTIDDRGPGRARRRGPSPRSSAGTSSRCSTETRWVIEGERGAARRLGLHPNTLRSRLKRWGVMRPQNAN